MKSETIKGYVFALIGTVAFSNVYIFSKAALNEVHLAQFGLYWFAVSTFLLFFYSSKKGKLKQLKELNRKQFGVFILLGILEILTTTSFFLSVHVISDPAVTSFLGNLFPVMLTAGGVFILGERFRIVEVFGVVLALAGAFIVSYTGGATFSEFFIPGTGIVLLNAFFATLASLVVKVHVKKISPELISLNRSVWLLIFSVIMMAFYQQPVVIPVSAFKNIAIGAFLGPFLAIISVYYSFRYIEASRSSIIQSLKGVFVLIGTYSFFGTLPLPHQLLGGGISVCGVLIMALSQAGIIKFKRVK